MTVHVLYGQSARHSVRSLLHCGEVEKSVDGFVRTVLNAALLHRAL